MVGTAEPEPGARRVVGEFVERSQSCAAAIEFIISTIGLELITGDIQQLFVTASSVILCLLRQWQIMCSLI